MIDFTPPPIWKPSKPGIIRAWDEKPRIAMPLTMGMIKPRRSLAFRSSATSIAATITVPADAIQGDLAVLMDRATFPGAINSVIPSGFTQASAQAISTARQSNISYRILGASPANTTITGMDGTTANRKILLIFSTGGASTASHLPAPFNSEYTEADPAAQTVSASGGQLPLVVLGFSGAAGTPGGPSFTGSSPAFSGTVSNPSGTIGASYTIYNSAPVDHTVDMPDQGTFNCLQSGYITVT